MKQNWQNFNLILMESKNVVTGDFNFFFTEDHLEVNYYVKHILGLEWI